MRRLLICAALLSAACAHTDLRSAEEISAPFSEIPFASVVIDGQGHTVSDNGHLMAIEDYRGGRVVLPSGQVPLAVVRTPQDELVVFARSRVWGRFEAARLSADGPYAERLNVRGEWSRQLHFLHAVPVGNALIVFAYDVESTRPSGRTSGQIQEGISVFVAQVQGDELRLDLLQELLPISSIDPQLRSARVDGRTFVCGASSCAILTSSVGAAPTLEVREQVAGPGRELIALESDGASAWAIARLAPAGYRATPAANETLYWVCRIDVTPAPCDGLPKNEVPLSLRVTEGRGVVERLSIETASASDRAALLRHDLEAQPLSGLPYYGVNNLEGRIAWGQVYALEGMADLAAVATELGDVELASEARRRLAIEMTAMSALCQKNTPTMASRRYSLDRSDIYSVVHVGRVAHSAVRALEQAPELGQREEFRCLMSWVASELRRPDRVMERLRVDATGAPYLMYRKGVHFWADGSNVPWNYQSAFVSGLVALPGVSAAEVDLAQGLVRSFIDGERFESQAAELTTWNYARGLFFDGWTAADSVSRNTPTWRGDKKGTQIAHISYRTMDAAALYEAVSRSGMSVSPAVLARIRELVEQGWLWPSVAGAARRAEQTPHFEPHVVALYARSVNAWDLQSQVWVLAP